MKNIHMFIILWISAVGVVAQEPTQLLDLQTEAYLAFVNGKEAYDSGDLQAALTSYRQALVHYQKIQQLDAGFKTDMVAHRVSECQGQVNRIQKEIGAVVDSPKRGQNRPRTASSPPGPTPIGGPSAVSPSPPAERRPSPSMIDVPEVADNPELIKQSADLEYMEKYIELLREAKELKQRMVAIETREETSNLTIRGLSKQVEEMSAERKDMLQTIEKANARNSDLLEALDAAEKYEAETARLKVALKDAEDKYAVLDAKLTVVEKEFQSGKESVRKNQQSVSRMEEELQQETRRANGMAVEIAKLKNEMDKPDPEVANLRKENRDLSRKIKNLQDAKDTQEITLKADVETAVNELDTLKQELAEARSGMEKAQSAEKKARSELEEAQAAEKEARSVAEIAQSEVAEARSAAEKAMAAVEDFPGVDELNKKLTTITMANEDLAALVEEKSAAIESMKSGESVALAALEEENAEALQDVKALELQVVELETEYSAATNEVKSLLEQVSAMETQLAAAAEEGGLAERITLLTDENQTLKRQVKDMEGSTAALELELSTLTESEEERSKALQRMKELQLNVESLKARSAAAGRQIDTLTSENEALVKVNLDLQSRMDQSVQEATSDLRAELSKREEERRSLEKIQSAVLADQVAEISALKQGVTDLQGQLDASRQAADSVKTALDQKSKEMQAMTREAGSATSASKRLNEKIINLESSKQALERELEKEGEKVKGLERELSTVLEEHDRFKVMSDRLSVTAKKSAADHTAKVADLTEERDAARKVIEEQRQSLEEKDRALSELQKQVEAKAERPKSNGIGSIVPLSALDKASDFVPFVDVRRDDHGGVTVEYPGIGKVTVR